MRFMLCARDRANGTVTLVSERSFLNRREAVEAISEVRDFSHLAGADIFIVDLESATPVAVVSVASQDQGAEVLAEDAGYDPSADAAVAAEEASFEDGADAESQGQAETEDVLEEELDQWAARTVEVGMVQIDIEAWTCEDCIYIATCAKTGTLRPAECGAFQWRA